jgi:hypothetical protein
MPAPRMPPLAAASVAHGPIPVDVTLCLASHTNVGKTTVARTLLGRDVGEVRDAAHVTQLAEPHELQASPDGDRLVLWDTPGFGDSVRLARRLAHAGQPIGWLLTEVWDRLRDRPFWMAQKAIRAVIDHADVVLYLADASDPQDGGAALRAELEVLTRLGRPVLVLLNQLGQPRSPQEEADEIGIWRSRTMTPSFPVVRGVLALDAFARCWVQEGALLDAVAPLLPDDRRDGFARLRVAWRARHEAVFEASMAVLAERLADAALDHEPVAGVPLARRLRHAAEATLRDGRADGPRSDAMRALAGRQQQRVREDTDRLIRLHGLDGRAGEVVLRRMDDSYAVSMPVDESSSAVVGGVVSSLLGGALAGLKVDAAAGGLTLGGGMLAGAVAGALGGAGMARGWNVWSGREIPRVSWSDAALAVALQEALLGYLAVAHYGRGRGRWRDAEHAPFWPQAVQATLEHHRTDWTAWLSTRSADVAKERGSQADDQASPRERLRTDGQVMLERMGRDLLRRLYPQAAGDWAAPVNRPPPSSSAVASR